MQESKVLTIERLRGVMPHLSEERAALFLPHLQSAIREFSLSSVPRLAAFLAQAAHESRELSALTENLNYSAKGLIATWPSRFGHHKGATERQRAQGRIKAEHLARHPVAIANYVYANRYGNGDEASGDGFTFRGRGIFQLTFLANYRAAGLALGLSLESNPDLVAEPEGACRTAGWFWQTRGLSLLADRGEFEALTGRINAGKLGLKERRAYYDRALEVLST